MNDRIDHVREALADRYAIERELGGGGMADVYLAEDPRHGRRVAVKVLRPEVAQAVGHERFLREIEIVAGLSHPHILPLHDSGRADDCIFFVMPFVEGESLRGRLDREGPLAIDEAVRIAAETADALGYAHARGVLHRDIKPENILLDSGHAIVADFGVALAVDRVGADRLTATGGAPGTPLYMSPEQASGDRQIDARTDVYSLGCVLYEMLIGEAPYTGGSARVMIARKMFEPLPGLRVVRETIPEPLEAVTRKALARTPADRFGSAVEFGEALVEAARPGAAAAAEPAGRPASARRDRGPPSLPTNGIAGRVWRVGAGGLAFVLLMTLIGYSNVRVVDYKLGVPDTLSPSQTDFLLVGFKAVVPFVIYTTLAFLAYQVAKSVWHGIQVAAGRVPVLGPTLQELPERVTRRWHALWRPVDARGIAEAALVVAIVIGAALLAVFWPLLEAMWWNDAERTEILSCANRTLHLTYQVVAPVVVAVMGVGWYGVFEHLQRRGAEGRNVRLARWGSGAWIVFLFVFIALPWQLLWGSEMPRAVLDGERVYVLAEDESEVLLYRPDRGATTAHRRTELPQLDRLGVAGYPFEDRARFESGESGCPQTDSSQDEEPS